MWEMRDSVSSRQGHTLESFFAAHAMRMHFFPTLFVQRGVRRQFRHVQVRRLLRSRIWGQRGSRRASEYPNTL